ncbi:hypothetical protein ABLN67_19205, partial [Mycobacterium tuberculosis]
YCFVQLSFGCLTVSSIGGNGVFAFIVKRFRVFRAPLQEKIAADVSRRDFAVPRTSAPSEGA